MSFKRRISLICILLIIFQSYARSFAEPLNANARTLRVAGDNNYPPYEYIDVNGVYKGFNIDIMRAMAIELGLDIELIPTNWENALSMLKNGEVDAIQGMTVSPGREVLFDFSNEIVLNSQSIFVLNSTSYISDLSDLSGKKVSIQDDDITSEILKNYPDIEVIERINQYESIRLLLDGEVDAFIGNRLTGIYNIQRFGLTESIKIVGDPLSTTPYSVAVINGNEELLTLFNKGLEEIKANGTYDKIYSKWFGENIVDVNQQWKDALYILLAVMIVVLILFMFIYLINRQLKKEVAQRTYELNLSNMFKDKVLNNIENGIIAFDSQMNVLQYNPLSIEILERNIDNGMNYNEIIADRIPEEATEKIKRGESWESNLDWIMENGQIKHTYCTLSPIKDQDKVEGYILSMSDRTSQVELYNMAKHKDKMQSLGVLSAGLAHELRNPLTSIKTFIDLIPFKIGDDNFKRELMNIVPKELKRLDNLVSSLLDYSKPRGSQPKNVNLSEIIYEISTMFKKNLQEKNVKLISSNIDINLYVDESQLKQILINIILNSVDAIEVEEGIIEITADEMDNKSTIIIKDNGKGIEKEALGKLFDPFYSSKSSGYGIGLSITDRLIRENHGTIKIESELGKGTSVIIQLPNCN